MERISGKVVHVFPGCGRGGGPAGYCHNLRDALDAVGGVGRIELLFPDVPYGVSTRGRGFFRTLARGLPLFLLAPLLALRMIVITRFAFRYFGFKQSQLDLMKQADVVVFHDPRLAYAYYTIPKRKASQKVIVMSHSPTDLATELVQNWQEQYGSTKLWPYIRTILATLEMKIYLNSNGILAPCKSALDAYFRDIRGREAFFRLPVYELASGVPRLSRRKSTSEVRAGWGIPLERKVVGFFGRHHAHKGYDLFCEAARLAHEKGYGELVFIAAGKGYLSSPHHLPNFRHLGYLTEQLPDAIAAVDLVVVPNRVTYFDLLLLEAMSLGKPILTSQVGGSLCINSPGVFYLKELTPSGLLSAILEVLSNPSLNEAGRANQDVYAKHYDLRSFGERHLKLAELLIEN